MVTSLVADLPNDRLEDDWRQDLCRPLWVALGLDPDTELTSKIGLSEAMGRRAMIVSDRDQCRLLCVEESLELLTWSFMIDPVATTERIVLTEDQFEALMTHANGLSGESSFAEELPDQTGSAESTFVVSQASIAGAASPAIRFVASVFWEALTSGASDIHLESTDTGMAAKLRLDGVLIPASKLNAKQAAEQAVSRIKVLAQLDISEHRVPQDGRFRLAFESRTIDIRVSVMPSVFGEDIVLRVLDREHLAKSLQGLTLEKLGFIPETVSRFKHLCASIHGLVLVTGPTGSGKTTTLYAAIAETRQSTEKIITIEDPVEYQLDGALQIPVNERQGLTFATGLRSILRHDPDRILIGEIRDKETADIAVQSALTGHVVYGTVHANGAFDVISRLAQLGTDPFALSTALNGVLAQRLIRLVCTECQGQAGDRKSDEAPTGGVRCMQCRNTGYSGRKAIGEFLQLTPEIKALVAARAPLADLQKVAHADGMKTLRDQALALVADGKTTRTEADRVTADA